jgi:serine/threonine protein kinase
MFTNQTSYHLPPGKILTNSQNNNQYRIVKTLGEGGFGITYQGTDLKTSFSVAIKENWPQGSARIDGQVVCPSSITLQDHQEQLTKFIREAQYIHQCQHPNIVKVYDWFLAHNTGYIVMEFLSGKSLAQLSQEEGGKLSQEKVKKYFLQVCQGLKVVHSNNLLHRDIKPDNIMLVEKEDKAVLIDFGNARQFIADKTGDMTKILTPGYAPPEQYTSTAHRNPSLDIYALCASMYELLTAQCPPSALDRGFNSVALIPPSQILPEIDPILDELILTGMKMKVQERFQSVDEIIDKLQQNFQTYFNLGLSYYNLKEYHKARDYYTKAIELEPNFSAAYYNRGLTYYDLKKYNCAIDDYTKAIELDPNDSDSYNNRGVAYARLGDYLKAIADYHQALDIDPNDTLVKHNLELAEQAL